MIVLLGGGENAEGVLGAGPHIGVRFDFLI
jgi:hypothetical protein